MDKSTTKLEGVFGKTSSENEKQQKIVAFEIDSDNSDYENGDIQSHIRALPNSSNFSIPMKKL